MLPSFLRRAAFAAFISLAVPASLPAAAIVTSFADIQFWVGTGSNQAALVIDWRDGSEVSSYAWGFRWNGSASGEDMLRAIAGTIAHSNQPEAPNNPVSDGSGDGSLSLYIRYFNFGSAGTPNYVPTVDRLSYSFDGETFDQDSDGFNQGFWSYWTATSSTLPAVWTESQLGFADRMLSNNSWDGWSFADAEATAPDAPVAAVPEPATFALLAAGGLALAAFRRFRHA